MGGKARLAEEDAVHGREHIAPAARGIAFRPHCVGVAGRDVEPEALKFVQPVFRLIAGDDGGIDGADGDTGDPVRLQPGFVEGLVHASLVSAKCAAALQDKPNAVAAFWAGDGGDGFAVALCGKGWRGSGFAQHVHVAGLLGRVCLINKRAREGVI